MNILGIIIALFVLGILIAVHELGHLIGAKMTGIGVDEYSIGMGREIFGFTAGGTRYRMGWIPFGGFCRMRGEESKDRDGATGKPAKPAEETAAEPAVPDPTAMYNRPAWARLIAVFFGPFFNYVFALVILVFLFLFGFHEQTVSPRVSVIQTDAAGNYTPAYLAGLQDGDTIIRINDQPVKSYSDVVEPIMLSIGKELGVLYVRDGATNYTSVTPVKDPEKGLGTIGISPLYTSRIGGVLEASPAAGIGMQEGDRITAINGRSVEYFYQLQKLIAGEGNREVAVTYVHGTNTVTKKVTLMERVSGTNANGVVERTGMLGIYPGEAVTFDNYRKSRGFFNAFAMGFTESNALLKQTWNGLKAIVAGKIDVQKNISGPIRIIQYTGKIATGTNFVTLLQFIALISIALGFFNLLPLPGLDGGHVVLNAFELITTIKPGEKVLRAVETAGAFVIIALAALVFLSDIINIAKGR